MAEEANPDNPVIITICLSLSQNAPPSWLFDHYLPLMIKHPRFASRVVLKYFGRFQFEPIRGFTATSAAVRDHHVQIEDPIDMALSHAERYTIFSDRLSKIMSSDLDRTRPLWKVFMFPNWSIIPEADPHNCATIVTRVHHSIADGIGLVKYFSSQVIDSSVNAPPNVLVVPVRQRNPNTPLSPETTPPVSEKKLIQLPTPSYFQRIREFFGDITASVLTFIPEPDNAFTRTDIQSEKVCALLPPSQYTVSVMKNAAKVFGATINDLLYTAVSGATRRYLAKHGDNPEELTSVRCVVPFNGHMFDDYKETDISNQIALVSLPLHISHESREERLEQCVTTLRRAKRGVQPVFTNALLAGLARVPRVVRKPLWRHLTRGASVLFTNVPGPKQVVDIGGIEVSCIHFFAPADGSAGVVVGLFSYHERLSLGVAGDKDRISDPQQFLDILAEEVDELIKMSKSI